MPVPDYEWSVPDRIPLRQTALFSSEGAVGKSIVQLHLCAAHALGKDWLGTMPEPGPAIFIDCEDDERVLHIRLAAILKHYGVTFADAVAGGLRLEDSVLGALTRGGKVEPTARYKQLLEAAGDIKPKMIGIASSADVFAGSEIDRSQVKQFISLLTRVAIVEPEEGEQPDTDLREITFKKNQYGPISPHRAAIPGRPVPAGAGHVVARPGGAAAKSRRRVPGAADASQRDAAPIRSQQDPQRAVQNGQPPQQLSDHHRSRGRKQMPCRCFPNQSVVQHRADKPIFRGHTGACCTAR